MKLSPKLFLPASANGVAASNVRPLLICPSLLFAVWVTARGGGETFFVRVARLDLQGLYVRSEGGGCTSDRRSRTVQRSREERSSTGETVAPSVNQLEDPYTNKPLMAAWESTTHSPLPLFLSFSGTFSRLLVLPKNFSTSIIVEKKWSHLPWTSAAVMDTHIRWKVKRRLRDAQITLAVILLFVTSQASSGKMQLWDVWMQQQTAAVLKKNFFDFFPPQVGNHLCILFYFFTLGLFSVLERAGFKEIDLKNPQIYIWSPTLSLWTGFSQVTLAEKTRINCKVIKKKRSD